MPIDGAKGERGVPEPARRGTAEGDGTDSQAARLGKCNEDSMSDQGNQCGHCGAPYQYDVSVPSPVWNQVVRPLGISEFLCLNCIMALFAERDRSFTAVLSSQRLDGIPIEVIVRGKSATDIEVVTDENNDLRWRLRLAEERAGDGNQLPSGLRGDPGAPRTVTDDTRDKSLHPNDLAPLTPTQGREEKIAALITGHAAAFRAGWATGYQERAEGATLEDGPDGRPLAETAALERWLFVEAVSAPRPIEAAQPDPSRVPAPNVDELVAETLERLEKQILGGEFGADDAALWQLRDPKAVTVETILRDAVLKACK